MNPFPYSDDNKRYQTQNYYLRHQFGGKVVKISLNAGLSCPNRDGRKGMGGCSFCSEGSGRFAGNPLQFISQQYQEVRERMASKWTGKCIAYFQAGTNTYAPLSHLKKLYQEALEQPDCVGLAISTRPDCVSEDTARYLGELSRRVWVEVELGLQTIHDPTAVRLNRCHTYQDFLNGYALLSSLGVRVCVHLINGLPGESREDMLESVRQVGKLRPGGVKLHLLHILQGTRMAEEYQRGRIPVMSQEEYANLLCDQLELLPPETVVQRVTGDGARDELLAPLWSLKKFTVMDAIDREMYRRDSWQGKRFGLE